MQIFRYKKFLNIFFRQWVIAFPALPPWHKDSWLIAKAPFDGDGDEREDAGEDKDRQSEEQQRAERVAAEDRPFTRRRHVLEGLQRHHQCRHERIARGQIDDVEIGDRSHVSVASHRQYDDGVA